MSIDARLNRLEAIAGSSTSREPIERVSRPGEAHAIAFNQFAEANGVSASTFQDFSNSLIALEAQGNGATK